MMNFKEMDLKPRSHSPNLSSDNTQHLFAISCLLLLYAVFFFLFFFVEWSNTPIILPQGVLAIYLLPKNMGDNFSLVINLIAKNYF